MRYLILVLFFSFSAYADTVDRFFLQVELGINAANGCISSNNRRSQSCQEFRVINQDIFNILKKKTNRDEIKYRANGRQKSQVGQYNSMADRVNSMLTR